MFEDKAEKMIGKKLTKISDEYGDITFHHSEDDYTCFAAEGECCSSSWIEHFDAHDCADNPETIVSFKEISLPEPEISDKEQAENNYEFLQFYFYRLTTDKGTYDVEMRNDSNGYYGGSLV